MFKITLPPNIITINTANHLRDECERVQTAIIYCDITRYCQTDYKRRVAVLGGDLPVLTFDWSAELTWLLYAHTTCTTFSSPFSTTYARFSVVRHCSSSLALENWSFWSLDTQLFIRKSMPPQSRNVLHSAQPSSYVGTAHALQIMSNILFSIVGPRASAYLPPVSPLTALSTYSEYFCMAFSTSCALATSRIRSRSSKLVFNRSSTLLITTWVLGGDDPPPPDEDSLCDD